MDETTDALPITQNIDDRTISQDKKEEIIQGEIQNVFEEDLYENDCTSAIKQTPVTLVEIKIPVIVFTIILAFLLSFEFIFKNKIPKQIYVLIVFGMILLDGYIFTTIFYKIVLFFLPKKNIYFFLLEDNTKLIQATIYLLCILISIIVFFDTPTKNFTFTASNKHIIGLINSVFLSFLLISLILLTKACLISGINYRNQHRYYKHRISLNNKYMALITKLNSIMNEDIYSNLKKWSKKIFLKISSNKVIITIKDLNNFFNQADSTYIFRLFDTNRDNSIEEPEFINRYLSIFREKRNLSIALTQNSSGLYKLNILCTLCTIPIMLFSTFMSFGAMNNYASSIGLMTGGILSFSFAFSSSISELIDCIVLVYFIRPFDIGDMIGFNNKKYIVKKIGLLYSDLIEDTTLNIISNKFLKNQIIENYRTSDAITETFIKYYSYKSIVNKMDRISEEIIKFLETNFTLYTPLFHIYKFDVVRGVLKLNIEINIRCKFQELRGVYKKRDKFEIWFTELASALELEEMRPVVSKVSICY
ncbi:Mechanosensitive ion channel protein Msy2 [Cucumispora dikerogammari]|nr:Mechanosensitive ion channel protein Msy2 [Cucumispora dikerogammari]